MFYHIKVLSRLQSKVGLAIKGQNALLKVLTLCFYQSMICQEEGKGRINTCKDLEEAKPRNYNTDTKSCVLLYKTLPQIRLNSYTMQISVGSPPTVLRKRRNHETSEILIIVVS